ncbi:hypothetical protein [Stigmatella hybrida]|uniref:hypothetical protein n=1 Tax=Stigmatella hybrida TaxID=394097 RepID=UPI001CDAD2A5|nr:hypothetical protein [Stigmatella hybrida]
MKRGAIGVSAGIAALLLSTGCDQNKTLSARQEGEQTSASQVVAQAHERTEKAFGQAEDAQKEANQQQDQATRAQASVEDAREELADAQNRAQQEIREAQQAQQQAQQAEQTVAAAQSSALEAQRQQQTELSQQAQQPVAPAATQGAQFIDGEVLTVNAQEVLVSVRGEPQVRLQLAPTTQVLVDGRQARATDIEEGSQIRASYQDVGGEPRAVRVEVTSQPAGYPAVPESGESTPGAVGP